MADLEKRFIVYVITPSGDDAFDFEMVHAITAHEMKEIAAIEDGCYPLVDSEELALLYSQLETKAHELAIQKFWDRNPDASDDAFNDYQVIVDIG